MGWFSGKKAPEVPATGAVTGGDHAQLGTAIGQISGATVNVTPTPVWRVTFGLLPGAFTRFHIVLIPP